jgi:hypothetical protein
MFVFLIAYRARGIQTFRKQQITTMMDNIKSYFAKYNLDYRIVIIEQNDDNRFNRGLLLNAAFIESQKLEFNKPKYIHFNVDYQFDLDRLFPTEITTFTTGFLDLHRPPFPVLGAACIFDATSYIQINGFPNDIHGWGADDWAIYNRINSQNITIFTPEKLFNSGFIIETNQPPNITDTSQVDKNMQLARRNDIDTNGLNTCVYTIEKNGEFHDGQQIFHFLINSPLFANV